MQTKADPVIILTKHLRRSVKDLGITDNPNRQKLTAYQDKEKKFPQVYIKCLSPGKIPITGSVKPPQQALNDGAVASCSNWDSEHLHEEEAVVNTPEVIFNEPYVKVQRLSAEKMEELSRKTPPGLPKPSNIQKLSPGKANSKSKPISSQDCTTDEDDDFFSSPIQWKSDGKESEPNKLVHRYTAKAVLPAQTSQTFNQLVEHIIQSTNNNDTSTIGDVAIHNEDLLNPSLMDQLVNETAIMKASGIAKKIPVDTIFTIFKVMELNMRGGEQILYLNKDHDENIGQLDRLLGAVNACLVCLHIMTSPDMPKRVYLEDVINHVVLCIKRQLENVFTTVDNGNSLKIKPGHTAKPKNADAPRFLRDGAISVKRRFSYVYQLIMFLKTVTWHIMTGGNKKKTRQTPEVLHDKILKLLNLLTEFLNIQVLTDPLVTEVASIAILSSFAKNIDIFEPASSNLITTTFTRYEQHRCLIFNLILSSAFRLCSSKPSLAKENIHVVTKLVLQLVQCVTILPEDLINDVHHTVKAKKINKDSLIGTKYKKAIDLAGTFIILFLNQCNKKSEDANHKPLFEHFIQDLTSLVNNPQWPASVLLLEILGRILVKTFSDKAVEVPVRVISLEYLCLIAAWLRRSVIAMQDKVEQVDQFIKKMKNFSEENQTIDLKEGKVQFMQEVLLDFIAQNEDKTVQDSGHFHIARWYNDLLGKDATKIANEATPSRNSRKRKRNQDETDVLNPTHKRFEARKKLLLNKLKPLNELTQSKAGHITIDYNEAELITQYLVSEYHSLEDFNKYITAILIGAKEQIPAIRTHVPKCLAIIVEADPALLARNDIQRSLNCSFLDSALSVREASIDLVGKFVLRSPELLDLYYEPLSARIVDASPGVRKRIIKILNNICIARPDSSKIPEICVKLLQIVNDDEGVGKMVVDVFQTMWFTPEAKSSLSRKVKVITHVATSQDVDLTSFQQLLENLFKPKDTKFGATKIQKEPPEAVLSAARQIVDCLMENVLKSKEEQSANPGSSQLLTSYSTTLYLFAKIHPELLVKHAEAMQPLLNRNSYSKDVQVVVNAAQILTLIVPLIPHSQHNFLAQLEQDCLNLAFRLGGPVISSCLKCLGSIVNLVTHNFEPVQNSFKKYHDFLAQIKQSQIASAMEENVLSDVKHRDYCKRALLFVGLLFQHFNFCEKVVDEAFETFLFFLHQGDEDIQTGTVTAIRSVCTRHYQFIVGEQLKTFYQRVLRSDDASLAMKSEVLLNIKSYLIEEEQRIMKEDLKWKTSSKQERFKKLDDSCSSMASRVIQEYLREILESYLYPSIQLRKHALEIVQLVLQQGLVHPVQIVPYLICMSTDCDTIISHAADKQLLELERKYPGLIYSKTSLGVKLSFRLQKILQEVTIIRGFRTRDQTAEPPIAFNGYLYSIVRCSRQQRRGLVLNMLKQFDEEHVSLSYVLYLADNIAYFTYAVQDEPLFIIHHIDMMVSALGTNLLQSFREGLNGMAEADPQQLESSGNDGPIEMSALDEDDDEEELLGRLPEDTSRLQAYLMAAQGCLLLLVLKQHLKNVYSLTDGKIQQYSPIESAKINEKPVSHRNNKLFNPTTTIQKLQEHSPTKDLDEEGRKNLINQYLEFKQLMLKLDRDEYGEKGHMGDVVRTSNSPNGAATSRSAFNSILVESGQIKRNTSNKQRSRKSQTSKNSKIPVQRKKRRKLTVTFDEESSDSDFMP